MAFVQRLREALAQRLTANFTTTLATAVGTTLSFWMAANEVWVVDVQLTAQCSSTGGIKYAVGTPAGATIEGWCYASGAAITTLVYQRITAVSTLLGTAMHTVATTPGGDILRFTVTNGATAGLCTI